MRKSLKALADPGGADALAETAREDISAAASAWAMRFPEARRDLFVRRVIEAAREASGPFVPDSETGPLPAPPVHSLPETAPEFYRTRANRRENPEEFILRVYGDPALSGLTSSALRRLDFKLYEMWAFHKARHDVRIHLATQREVTDLKARRLGLDPGATRFELDPSLMEAAQVRDALLQRARLGRTRQARSRHAGAAAAVPPSGEDDPGERPAGLASIAAAQP